MKLIFYFLLLLSILQLSSQQQLQTQLNIYINNNSGSDSNGDGTITNPYQTICKLNQILYNTTIINTSTNTITINIAYGDYYNVNRPCIIEIININNITILPYGDDIGGGSDSERVNIKYINFNIINSTISLNNLNISISNNESNSEILDNGLTINNSSVLFSNVDFNLSSNSDEVYDNIIINSIFKIQNSKLIYNENNRELQVSESTIQIQNSFLQELSIFNMYPGKPFDLIVDESTALNCVFKTYYGNINISNSFLQRDGLTEFGMIEMNMLGVLSIINTTVESISSTGNDYSIFITSGSTTIYLENVIFSSFKNFNILLYFTAGDITIKDITFKNCEASSLISIDPWLITKLVVSIDGLNLINNKCKGVIQLVSYSNITVNNISARCDNNFFINGILPPLFTMNSFVLSDYKQKSNISVSNSNLECFGSTTFVNSFVQYENISFSKSTFSGNFISLVDKSQLNLVSSKISNVYNIEQPGYFFNLIENSSINISDCFISQISTPFINAYSQSSVTISNLNFNSTRSNLLSFINIENNSAFQLDNCNFNQYYGSMESSLINIGNNSKSFINSVTINQSWFEFGSFLSVSNSQSTVQSLSMYNCFSNNLIFLVTGGLFGLYNSNFTNNDAVTTMIEMFLIYNTNMEMVNCQFISNSFQPFIENRKSTLKFKNILFQKNTGPFFKSVLAEYIEFTSFKMFGNNDMSNDYFINIQKTKFAIFNQIEFINNLFSNYLISSFESMVEFNNMVYRDNIITNNYYLVFYPEDMYDNAQFQFTTSNCTFNNLMVIDNTIATNLFVIKLSDVSIASSNISSNVIKNNSTLFATTGSNLQFINCEIIGNNAIYSSLQDNTKGIIVNLDGNIIIDSCNMSFNIFTLSKGCIASFKLSINDDDYDLNYLSVLNSTFIGNTGDYGSVFLVDLQDTFDQETLQLLNTQLELRDNTFLDNYAKHTGGVVYTSNFAFSSNMTGLYNNNSFINNTCSIRGIPNDFSSLLKGLSSNNTQLYYESQTIQYSFVDYYNNTVDDIFGYYQISVVCGNISNSVDGNESHYSSLVIGGNGTFVWSNKNECQDEIVISVLNVLYISPLQVQLNGCPEFKYLNASNQCQYCRIGWTLPRDGKHGYQCYHCDSNKQTCVGSSVFAFNGYYLGNKEPFECAIDMCEQGNKCPSSYYSGDLCFHCADDNGDKVVSKNGIQCCNHFKPTLLLPILIIIIVFSLLLSIGKYKFLLPSYSFIVSIIIFLQINSVVFFSYRLYFLPLFRLSIDMFDGYCLWSNLNYNFKSFIIFIIIISSFVISSSDITLKFINTIYYPTIKRILPNSKLSVQSKFIKRLNIVNNNNNIYKMRSVWSLFQVYIIPLLFNSISLLVFRSYPGSDVNVLMVDFSIVQFGNNEAKFFYSLSLIILSIVSMIVVASIIVMVIHHGKLKNLKNIVNNTNYSNTTSVITKYFNWDQINIIRSYLYILLSLTMIFNTTYYMLIIISIQMVYTITFYLVNPFKKKCSNQHLLTNLINLFQLIIFVVCDSELFQLLDPFYKGLTITCCSFFTVIAILFYNYTLKQRNNKKNLKLQ